MTAVVTNTGSSALGWIKPHYQNERFGIDLSKGDGADDFLEAIINVFDWMAYFGNKTAEKNSEQLEPINQAFALPSFFSNLLKLPSAYQKSESWTDRDLFNPAMLAIHKGAKSAFFFESVGAVVFKNSKDLLKKIFWSPLLLMEVMDVKHHLGQVGKCKGELELLHHESAAFNQAWHKTNISYLSVARCACTVAMASIALVSLTFASFAKGVLFSPPVFLGLMSSWCILNYVILFYQQYVDHQAEKAQPVNLV